MTNFELLQRIANTASAFNQLEHIPPCRAAIINDPLCGCTCGYDAGARFLMKHFEMLKEKKEEI